MTEDENMSDEPSPKITIVIADDDKLARIGIRKFLSQVEDFKIVGEAKDGFEIRKLIPKLRPKILLLDYRMPGPRAFEQEKWVRENHPETLVLVLTAHERDAYLTKTIESGMAGFLLKHENLERLTLAIRRAAEGTAYFSDEQIERARQWKQTVETKWEALSQREREVLQHLAAGEDNKSIAAALSISLKTIEFHVTSILKKLELNSRNEVIVWALKHQPDDPWAAKD
ncbi:MAG: response regulator transcription factor [Anaerolineales bacterium]|nr:response regulator transcription factor [Anaerolineales bacterium]